jgi:hypothetical protein
MRLALAFIAAVLVLPSSAGATDLPRAHRVDLSHATAGPQLPDLNAKPRIPASWFNFAKRGEVHAADHWGGDAAKEERYQDEHGHVLTLATDNAAVDLAPIANLLASTYHYGEIEFLHAFVTSDAEIARLCGADAVACYAADNPGRSRGGVMIISYENTDQLTHAVIHEYGHHVDTNTYNLGGLSDCGINGDGSRRWFFARNMQDRILDRLSCDPEGDWGQLLPEVYAEDYAQMVGIPRSEYHPAITVPPPSTRQKNLLRADLDSPFTPTTRKLKGRSSSRGVKTFRVRIGLPVFLSARKARGVRSVRTSGCTYQGFRNVFEGTCRVVVRTKKARGRFSLNLVAF